MKNFFKYFFSILMMISCLILFTMTAYKVLFTDDSEDVPGSAPSHGSEENEGGSEEEGKGEDKPEKEETADKAPNPKDAPFTTTDETYFSDALFIGDSRTMGLWEYGQIEGADFFANTGMNVYNVREKTVNVTGAGGVTLEKLLGSKKYGKIYLGLGINELGYDMDQTVRKYGELVKWIREKQPEAILFIEANMHVAAKRSDSDKIFNNERINTLNSRIAELIDNRNIFYIDVNEIFDDEKGNLAAEYTSDNTHILAKYYANWVDWLLTQAIVK